MADVVGYSSWQRQREQGVGYRKVDQIDGGGVELLLPLADHVEHQAVATCADDENQRVENRKEDDCGSLVDQHVAAALVRVRRDVVGSHRGRRCCLEERSQLRMRTIRGRTQAGAARGVRGLS